MLLADAAAASEVPAAGARKPVRCVERRLDTRSGMMITRYGCTRAPQGRWRDVAKLVFGAARR